MSSTFAVHAGLAILSSGELLKASTQGGTVWESSLVWTTGF